MGTSTEDMIARCQEARLPEPQFAVTDGFVVTLGRRPGRAFDVVGGTVTPPVTPPLTPPVTPSVGPPLEVLVHLLGRAGALGNADIRIQLGLRDRTHLRERYIDPALAAGLVEPTIPNTPKSRLQRYKLTAKGVAWLQDLLNESEGP